MNVKDILESLKKGSEANKQADQFNTEGKDVFHQYNEKYRERHGHSKVICVGMDEPVSLDDVYVDVQFLRQRQALQFGTRENVENSEEALRERGKNHAVICSNDKQDGMRVANDKSYLMLIGGPGVGKSTFLRKIGLEALKGEDGKFEHKCIPVFLELKGFTEDPIDTKALIVNELEICGYPNPKQNAIAALKSGKFLILLDGLDEVPSENFVDVVREIKDFVTQYHQNRFIVSSRRAVNINGFTDVEMADFDEPQVERYINNWFILPSDLDHQIEEGKKNAEQCWRALNAPEHQTIKALAQNPLLLTFLCVFYKNKQHFPRNRAELYESALNIFLEEWPHEKFVPRDALVNQGLDISTVEGMLSEIAARNFDVNHLLFKRKELIDQIQEFCQKHANTPPTFDASKTLDAIRVDPGLFIERFKGVYSFFHLTFQEYLTANHFVRTQSIQGLGAKHLHNERWREVFLFTAELMPEADSLLLEMTTEASKVINSDRLKMLFRWAKSITNTSDNRYDKTAKQIFAIRQYFSLWLLNETYKAVKNDINQYPSISHDLNQDLYLDLYLDRDLDMYLYRKGYRDSYSNRKRYRYRELDSCLDLYLNLNLYVGHKLVRGLNQSLEISLNRELDSERYRYRELGCYINYYQGIDNYLDPCFYQDPYQYIDIDFCSLISSRLGDSLESELGGRITLLKRIEQLKIFKKVNLQRMIQRLNAQRKFIKEARKGEVVELPEESIHDTWLSILGITDDMLAISCEEMESYIQYLRSVQLILTCKEASERVSPEVWQKIEDQFLAWDAEEIED